MSTPGLVKNVFDNNQMIGKTYKITGENKVPSIVITSHLWISLDTRSDIQENVAFSRGLSLGESDSRPQRRNLQENDHDQ